MRLFITCLLPFLFLTSPAQAGMTLAGVQGASRADIVSKSPTIWGGTAGNCADSDFSNSNTPCNSCIVCPTGCAAGDGTCTKSEDCDTRPCNRAPIFDTLNLRIDVRTDNTALGGGTIGVKRGSNSIVLNPVPTVTVGQSVPVIIPWGTLCGSLVDSTTGAVGGSGCDGLTTGAKAQITIGISKKDAASFDEQLSINIVVLPADPATVQYYDECSEGSDIPKQHSFCIFRLFPGDEKAYIDMIAGQPGTTYYTPYAQQTSYIAVEFFFRKNE